MPDLYLMIPNNRRQYTHCRQRHIAEYSEATRNYRENNRDEINARQRNFLKMQIYPRAGDRQRAGGESLLVHICLLIVMYPYFYC